jgi:hypothetical protein
MRRLLPELALLALLALLLGAGVAVALSDLIPPPQQLDFAAYYLAALALNAGLSPYDLDALRAIAASQGRGDVAAYIYPPAFAALLRPLAALPLATAELIWLALQLVWLAGAACCLARLARLPPWSVGALFGLGLLTPAVQHTLELGQVNLLLLLLIGGAFLLLNQERGSKRSAWQLLGGALLAAATLLKLFPALLVLPLFTHRRGGALLGFGLGALLLLLVGLGAGGGATTSTHWASEVLPRYAGGFATPNNQSLPAATARLFTPTSVSLLPVLGLPAERTLPPLLDAPTLGVALGYGLSLAVVAATLWLLGLRRHSLRQMERSSFAGGQALPRPPLAAQAAPLRQAERPSLAAQASPLHRIDPAEIALLVSATLLALPLAWYHYFTLLLLPYAAAAA